MRAWLLTVLSLHLCRHLSAVSFYRRRRKINRADTRRLGARSVGDSGGMSKYVDENVEQLMGRRVQNTDDEDSGSGDELDFSKLRQQLKQQQQQPPPPRTSTVPLLPGLLAVENGEDGEEERSDQTHVTQHHTAALCEACRAGDAEALRRLLALPGTQVGAANAEGESPLHVAARAGHAACVRQLAATSADLNLQSAQQDGATPLLLAARGGAHGLETLKALLEAGADPNGGGGGRGGGGEGGGGEGGGGAPPLLVAACDGPSSAVRVLLAAGAQPNAKDASGSTALHEGVFSAAADRVELLLAARADAALCNGRGRSPLELAAQLGHAEIVALFEQEEEERDAELRGDRRSV